MKHWSCCRKAEQNASRKSLSTPLDFIAAGVPGGDEYIDWEWGSERIHNFVRGIAGPAPGARTFLKERECVIDLAEMIENAPDYLDKPGCIVGKDGDSITVKTGDSTLRVLRVLDVVTREEIPVRGLRIGMRFTSGIGVLGEDMKDKAVIVIGAGGH